MNKTDLLLQMMDQPHQYTADEWQEILADNECRELYMLMSKTKSAIDVVRADEEITDEMINDEWKRLNTQSRASFITRHSSLFKFAAMFIGILLISGIAYAAIHIVRQYQKPETPQTERVATIKKPVNVSDTLRIDSTIVEPVIYDNVPLEKLLPEIATQYGASVIFQDDASRQLRLFYQWKPEYTMEKIVEMLNNFETLQLQLEGDTLFVSSTIDQ